MGQRTAVITGAGSGIGRAAALLLAGAGYRVALVGRTAATLEATKAAISSASGAGDACAVLPADVTDAGACRQVIDMAVARFERIDALANVAGYASLGPIEAITPREWRTTIDANLSGAMYLTAAVWPVMARQESGVIVNVSSMASIDPFEGFALYASAKAALNMFTLVTAREGAAAGIKAVAIAPGAVETPMLRSLWGEDRLPPSRTLDPAAVAVVIRDCIVGTRVFSPGELIRVPSP